MRLVEGEVDEDADRERDIKSAITSIYQRLNLTLVRCNARALLSRSRFQHSEDKGKCLQLRKNTLKLQIFAELRSGTAMEDEPSLPAASKAASADAPTADNIFVLSSETTPSLTEKDLDRTFT
ncbi:hypothetical protein EMCRGX_G020549 [Ephydatia muelleri]